MKAVTISIFLSLAHCSLNSDKAFDLFSKIENQELILKSELENQLFCKLPNYEDGFIGTGAVLYSGDVKTGIVQGKRNDTIMDVLIVCKGNRCIGVRENPNSTFYRKDGGVYREYVLGEIYLTYKEGDITCIRTITETFIPFRIDTLSNMFHKSQVIVLHKESEDFCMH